MAPLIVVEFLKTKQLPLQITSIPKGHEVEVLSPDRPDKPFHKRVRNRQVGHRLYFGYGKYSKISLPPMEPEQRVIIAADVSRRASTTDRLVEHSAQRWSVDIPNLYAEANDSPAKLIHDNHNPVGLEDQRFTSKKIHAP